MFILLTFGPIRVKAVSLTIESPGNRASSSSKVFDFPRLPTWSLLIRKSELVLHWINKRDRSATAKSENLDILDKWINLYYGSFRRIGIVLSHYLFQYAHYSPYKSGTGKHFYYRVLPGTRSAITGTPSTATCSGHFFFRFFFGSFDLVVQEFIGTFPIDRP